jgi:hypothetical protein
MKVSVSKVDVQVEGDATEIREAMPSILGTHTTTDAPLALAAAPQEDSAALPPPVRAELEAADGLEVDEDVIRTVADVQIDPDATVADVPDAPVPADGYEPVENWQQVPTSRRVWGSNSTLHVATEPNGLELYCSHEVGGLRRQRNWSPVPLSIAKVCGSCNREIKRRHRKDH